MPSKKADSLEFPVIGYAGYSIAKFFDIARPISFLFDRLESMSLKNEIKKTSIIQPIYITGLVRSGTTITLEMLNKHPDLTAHRYMHMLLPYVPYWYAKLVLKTNFYKKPVERVHKDGIYINRESPEAVEEILWRKFFPNILNESISNPFDGHFSNVKFENFYRHHIKKLLLIQEGSRYLCKNNYIITRMEYVLRIFPDAKFLLLIRNPVNQIASIIKQVRLFIRMEEQKPAMKDWSKIIGHNEFGNDRVCINTDNSENIKTIHQLWKDPSTYVKGWALYWSSIYKFAADRLDANENLRKSTLIIRYENLCANPATVIDKILAHANLSSEEFKSVKSYYIAHLHEPTYYRPDFSKKELTEIKNNTESTAIRFGYYL